MNQLESMFEYGKNVVDALQSSKIYDDQSDLDDQALVAYTFGVYNGYAKKYDITGEDLVAVLIRLISEHIGYPVDYSEAMTQFMIQCTDKSVNETIYIIIHKGLDAFVSHEEDANFFKSEYETILKDLKAVVETSQPPTRKTATERLNEKFDA